VKNIHLAKNGQPAPSTRVAALVLPQVQDCLSFVISDMAMPSPNIANPSPAPAACPMPGTTEPSIAPPLAAVPAAPVIVELASAPVLVVASAPLVSVVLLFLLIIYNNLKSCFAIILHRYSA
jgi:hypothetical protein